MHLYLYGSSGDPLCLYSMRNEARANELGTSSALQILLSNSHAACLQSDVAVFVDFRWYAVRPQGFAIVHLFYVFDDFVVREEPSLSSLGVGQLLHFRSTLLSSSCREFFSRNVFHSDATSSALLSSSFPFLFLLRLVGGSSGFASIFFTV